MEGSTATYNPGVAAIQPDPLSYEPAQTRPGGPNAALPYLGVKQKWNAPLDFGPHPQLFRKSFPGGKHLPPPNQVITIYFTTVTGQKAPLRVRQGDTIETLRHLIFQKMQGQMEMLAHDDDADCRFDKAVWMPGAPTLLKNVKDCSVTTYMPGERPTDSTTKIDPSSVPTDRVLRKTVPCPKNYVPPKRLPQEAKDLDLYAGLVKLEDAEIEMNKSINTGGRPEYIVNTLASYSIVDGYVLRAEYKKFASEYKIKNPDLDTSKLGSLPDVDTVTSRLTETVLDPDFYVATVEQTPKAFMDFFFPSFGNDFEDSPFVGRLVPMPDKSGRPGSQPLQPPIDPAPRMIQQPLMMPRPIVQQRVQMPRDPQDTVMV